MKRAPIITEQHFTHRVGWLRAAVLGANDGIVSTSSLIVGVAAAHSSQANILIAGVAGIIAGAMSMAAGEYVSVSSQTDTEKADLARERKELRKNTEYEHEELAAIYAKRGLDMPLARIVATKLMAHDALGAHAREELGIMEVTKARPAQAAFTSALTFSMGAALPLLVTLTVPTHLVIPSVSVASLIFLIILGALSAYIGGANIWKGALRVTFWGAFALGLTAGIGTMFGIQ